jgi:hypothetical protein
LGSPTYLFTNATPTTAGSLVTADYEISHYTTTELTERVTSATLNANTVNNFTLTQAGKDYISYSADQKIQHLVIACHGMLIIVLAGAGRMAWKQPTCLAASQLLMTLGAPWEARVFII